MTDFQLRLAAIKWAQSGNNQTQPMSAVDIYDWLKEANQPILQEVGYTISTKEGRLTIVKHSEHGQAGMSLDDLWRDLHQPAPEDRRGCRVAQLQDQAAADPAEEPQETTPQYEVLKRAVLIAIRDYYSPNTDSHLVYRTRVFDSVMVGLIGGTWLSQPDSPMPGDCSSFRPANEQPAPVFEPWLVTVLRIDKLNYLMDACKRQRLCESYAKYKAERDALLDGLPSAMLESSPEVKAALAQATDEINPATPQEDFEARRAHEAKTNGYLLGRLKGFSQVVAVMDRLGLDGDAERFRAEEQRLANVLAERGFCLNSESPAEQPAAKRVPKIGDIVVFAGKEYVVYVAYSDSGNFRAIQIDYVSRDNTFYFDIRMENQDRGWTFKD